MDLKSHGVAIATSLIALLALPASAGAATAVVSSNNITYTAGAAELNDVTVSSPAAGIYRFTEVGAGVTVTPGAGCATLSATETDCTDATPLTAPTLTISVLDGADAASASTLTSAVTFSGGTGDDSLTGGSGSDTATYSSSATAVIANLATGVATGEGTDTFSQLENLTGSPQGDTLTGDASANTLFDGGGANTINAGAGDDLISVGGGTDTINGEDGADQIFAGGGNDEVNAGPGNDTTVNGSTGNDELNGGAGNDFVAGGDDDDVVDGGNGNDSVQGGLGTNTLRGGAGDMGYDLFLDPQGGDDTIDGGPGIDRMRYGSVGVTVTIDNVANDTDGQGGTDNVMDTIESISGSTGADAITGSCFNNVLAGPNFALGYSGTDGNDTLIGDPAGCGVYGNDFLGGGLGNDTMRGSASLANANDGVDRVTYTANSSAQAINVTLDGLGNDSDGLDTNTLVPGIQPGLDNVDSNIEYVYGGAGADTINATAALQGVSLWGRAGGDSLVGSAMNDFLDGETGVDTLDCGAGLADMYRDADSADTVLPSCETQAP